MTEWVIEECRSWRVPGFENVERTAHTEGRDASRFNLAGDQSNGLMTHWSYRDQQRNINFLCEQTPGDLWGKFLCHPPRGINTTHKREEIFSQRSNNPFFYQSA